MSRRRNRRSRRAGRASYLFGGSIFDSKNEAVRAAMESWYGGRIPRDPDIKERQLRELQDYINQGVEKKTGYEERSLNEVGEGIPLGELKDTLGVREASWNLCASCRREEQKRRESRQKTAAPYTLLEFHAAFLEAVADEMNLRGNYFTSVSYSRPDLVIKVDADDIEDANIKGRWTLRVDEGNSTEVRMYLEGYGYEHTGEVSFPDDAPLNKVADIVRKEWYRLMDENADAVEG